VTCVRELDGLLGTLLLRDPGQVRDVVIKILLLELQFLEVKGALLEGGPGVVERVYVPDEFVVAGGGGLDGGEGWVAGHSKTECFAATHT
jgi:hypothetical protein